MDLLTLISSALAIASVFSLASPPQDAAENAPDWVTVSEVFFTSRNLEENVDTPAYWSGSAGERWLISTTKATHSLLVEDAANGAFIKRVGGLGPQLGQFNRPNGVFVIDDVVFVVERDNRRVQALALPAFSPLGTFGEELLTNPYGLYVRAVESEVYELYVSDNYEIADESVPPVHQLGERIAIFEVVVEGVSEGTMDAEFSRYLGETSGEGAIRIAESINGDPVNGNLLIAEEDTDHPTAGVKVYDFQGRFTGQILGRGQFKGQAEGIALVVDGERDGYWICADQGMRENWFHVFDRVSLSFLGAFRGQYTLNTDGVWFTSDAVSPRFPEGVFYAVHNDGNVAAFDWGEVKKALGLYK